MGNRSRMKNDMSTVDMGVIQLANLKKNYILEMRMVEGYRRRIKETEREVAKLRKEERGLGLKKLRVRKQKLEKHVEKMDGLIEAERTQREQSEKDVSELTAEVGTYSEKYEEILGEVNSLMEVKSRLETEIEKRTIEFKTRFKEQEQRIYDIESELAGMERLLLQDNLLRNKISGQKGGVEELLDKLKDLLGKEEENIENDKAQMMKEIEAIAVVKPKDDVLKRLSVMRAGAKRASMMQGDSETSSAFSVAMRNESRKSQKRKSVMREKRMSYMQGSFSNLDKQ